MVIVEGDASINTYEDAEGRPKTALNIVQRTSRALVLSMLLNMLTCSSIGNIEVLRRPTQHVTEEE